MTQKLTSSTAACLLKTCHQANVAGFYAELNSDTNRQSLEHCANNNFVFQQVPVDVYAFGLPFRRRFTLFSVNVPVHLKLARRCEIFGNVCSFSGKAHRQLGPCFKRSFLASSSSSSTCDICCSSTCSLVPCHGQLDKQAALVDLNHGQGHRWRGRGMQFLELIAEHPRTERKLSVQNVSSQKSSSTTCFCLLPTKRPLYVLLSFL